MNGVPGPAPARCGTYRGYKRHRNHGELPCLPCYAAAALAEDDRRKAPARRAALEEALSRRGPRKPVPTPAVPDPADIGPGYEAYREMAEASGRNPWTGAA